MASEPQGFESLPRRLGINPCGFKELEEYLRDRGLKDSTIEYKIKIIKHLSRKFNLWDSENISKYIKRSRWGNRRKNNVSYAYKDFCQWKGFDYVFARFKEEDQSLPYIPLEGELDQLIAGFGKRYSCYLQLLKESGFRPSEAIRLTANDVDLERKIITLNEPSKGSRPRQFKMSDKLTAMITPFVKQIRPNEAIWRASSNSMRRYFCEKREYVAEKLGNPRLLKISMKTFRHWKATMEYHRTKDLLHVQQVLGHKSIKNTMIYTHLVDFGEEDIWICKVAHTLDEAMTLIEGGFEFVIDFEGKKLFRKRK